MSYDNTCKYLAENYPAEFARWLLSSDTSDIEVLKTELNLEPIRADAVTFLQISNQILHLEFQTSPKSTPPLDFRMLDYYTRLKRQYWCDIEQVLIFLQATSSEIVFNTQYVDRKTRHEYRVIRLWEEDPTPLLANPALLPLATLARTDSPQDLLEQVAAAVDMIEERDERQNISACVQVLAGLRFPKNLITQLFREEVMQESVIYQDILQKGLQQGEQRGLQKGEVAVILRLLIRRFGAIEPEIQQQIQSLSITQLDELAEALLDFSSPSDLLNYLVNISPAQPNQ
ncbi:Rpn family recombination-promoting nuclease/putative transposase [Scytonema sp. PCC 10023]|uniref:Rpn family recombination-promoting nuclease/putative transposase n=1 Tax=Scytonema sp. PCC 10023 TaxID=1680591 RepID=UPI0039C75296